MDRLYRGYVRLHGKKCIDKYATDELKTLEEVCQCDGYGGVLREEIVMIDVDNEEEADLLHQILEDLKISPPILKTTRGKHFYFLNDSRKNKTNCQLALGVHADIKVGPNQYTALKVNDVKREFIQYGTLVKLPSFLYPVKGHTNLKLTSGDGRNSTLYSYILTLQKGGLTKENVKETLSLINEYILTDPLEIDELNTIMRDEAFVDENDKFKYYEYACKMIDTLNIKVINNILYHYDDGVYVPNLSFDLERLINSDQPQLTTRQIAECVRKIELTAPKLEMQDQDSIDHIVFNNGTLNLKTMELEPNSADRIILNKIPHNYNPNAQSEDMQKFLWDISDGQQDILQNILELVGYCFYRKNNFRKGFILTGITKNGKSTFLKVLYKTLGAKNCSGIELSEINERFKTYEMLNKMANIGDDINNDYISNSAIFKKLVSGDMIQVETKGKPFVPLYNYAKLIFSANDIPRLGNGNDAEAVTNRLIIIPFKADFSKSADINILDKLYTEESIECLINLGIKALKQLLTRNQFYMVPEIEEEIDLYAQSLDNVAMFMVDENPVIEGMLTKDLYKHYCDYCTDNGFKPKSNVSFGKIMRVKYLYSTELTRMDNRVYRRYVRKKEDLNEKIIDKLLEDDIVGVNYNEVYQKYCKMVQHPVSRTKFKNYVCKNYSYEIREDLFVIC